MNDRKINDAPALVFDEDWVTVATYRDLGAAEIARVTLEAAGLTCFLADAEVIRLDWALSTALGGIKLRVPAVLSERALEILRQTAPPQHLVLVKGRGEEQEERCPRCASFSVKRLDSGRRLVLAALLLGLPLVFRWRRNQCGACGHRWPGHGGAAEVPTSAPRD